MKLIVAFVVFMQAAAPAASHRQETAPVVSLPPEVVEAMRQAFIKITATGTIAQICNQRLHSTEAQLSDLRKRQLDVRNQLTELDKQLKDVDDRRRRSTSGTPEHTAARNEETALKQRVVDTRKFENELEQEQGDLDKSIKDQKQCIDEAQKTLRTLAKTGKA